VWLGIVYKYSICCGKCGTSTSRAEFRDGVSPVNEAGDLKFEILNKCGKFE